MDSENHDFCPVVTAPDDPPFDAETEAAIKAWHDASDALIDRMLSDVEPIAEPPSLEGCDPSKPEHDLEAMPDAPYDVVIAARALGVRQEHPIVDGMEQPEHVEESEGAIGAVLEDVAVRSDRLGGGELSDYEKAKIDALLESRDAPASDNVPANFPQPSSASSTLPPSAANFPRKRHRRSHPSLRPVRAMQLPRGI